MPINDVAALRTHLQWAIELEHATLPPYLCALYSIKPGHNKEAAEVIHSVFMEEMLHLTLAANLLNAVGGKPELDKPSILAEYPTFLPHSNQAFVVPLVKFSREALDVFMQIEKPGEHEGLPEDDNYETIGQFYASIEEALSRLCDDLGEEAVFSGDPARQITDDLYYGGSGKIIAVTDLASARAALEEIVEQGEGLQHQTIWDGDRNMFHPEREEVGHYFRFHEIAVGRRYQRGDTPQSGPSGASFEVDWDAVYDMKPNPRSADHAAGSAIRNRMDDFNRTYSGILHLLQESFNGKRQLLLVATGAMYELKQQAIQLMQLPTGDGETTAGPSFEYVPPESRHLAAREDKKIVVLSGGPYVVYGDVPLVRKERVLSEGTEDRKAIAWKKTETISAEETYALCRCGHSSAKPFCDGTHARIEWDGTETADTASTKSRQYAQEGTGLEVRRDEYLCMHSAFCIGRARRIPAMMEDSDDTDIRAQIIGMIERCPSGSYTYSIEPGEEDIEPDYPVAIAVTSEGNGLAGCLWVTGGIPAERSDALPFETRPRMTLCRCGQSARKPLCDGTHRKIGFTE
jgi:CDGSH-type Zn-finger protein